MDRIQFLQDWLALEHEAVWLYGVIGGRIDDLTDAARRSWDQHRATRDRLAMTIETAGGTPVGPALGYEPIHIDSADAGRRAAQSIEQRISAACVATLASPPDKKLALRGLQTSAVAATRWGADPQSFPGLR